MTNIGEFGIFGLLAVLICGVIFAIFAVLAFRSALGLIKEKSYFHAILAITFGTMWTIPIFVALYYGWFLIIIIFIGTIIYMINKRRKNIF